MLRGTEKDISCAIDRHMHRRAYFMYDTRLMQTDYSRLPWYLIDILWRATIVGHNLCGILCRPTIVIHSISSYGE